jgi:SAM-dependent methyltransferase
MSEYTLEISEVELLRYRMMAQRAQAEEADLWQLAGLVPGATVADVGCGPAAMSVVLAQTVGPSGRVVGVERDEASLEVARQLVAGSGIDTIELRSGAASETGLAAGSFDVVMCRHVLAHNGAQEQQIVDHLVSICAPGGTVYLVDVDGTAMRILDVDPELADLTDRYQQFHARRGNDLLTGLRLGKLLAAAGLEVLVHRGRYTILPAPPGLRPPSWAARHAMMDDKVASEDDVQRWQEAFERMDVAAVRPTLFVPTFVALGRKAA